jgi:polyisoprenoid-binding protein YceI
MATRLFVSLLLSVSLVRYTPVDEQSEIKFSIKNFGVATTGTFTGLQGLVEVDTQGALTRVQLHVDASTVNTGIGLRDNHLRKEKYFDVKNYPKIQFISSQVIKEGNQWMATGKITIKKTTKEIRVPFSSELRNSNLIVTGKFSLNRRDFNVGDGSLSLADELEVNFKITLIPANP